MRDRVELQIYLHMIELDAEVGIRHRRDVEVKSERQRRKCEVRNIKAITEIIANGCEVVSDIRLNATGEVVQIINYRGSGRVDRHAETVIFLQLYFHSDGPADIAGRACDCDACRCIEVVPCYILGQLPGEFTSASC
jgi:hypothetical protein